MIHDDSFSSGVLLLMPVVFSEMMLCEAFVKDLGGVGLEIDGLMGFSRTAQ